MCLVTQSCPTLGDPMDCNPLGSSVHGILQARVLEWVAISSSRGSSQPRDRTQVSRIVGGFFAIWATREAQTSSGHLLRIITLDVFKDDLFLFIQTLWSKYYNFHLQNEEPEYQSYQETCSSSHCLNITLSSPRICVLCNVRRVWKALFSLDDRRVNGMNSSVSQSRRWQLCHDDSHIIKQPMRVRCWPALPGKNLGEILKQSLQLLQGSPSGMCPFLLQIRRTSTSLGADPR